MDIDKAKTCCCLGEWSLRDSHLVRKIVVAAEQLVKDGVDTFLCIGAGHYDTVCARVVRDLQQRQLPARCLLVAAREDTPRYDPALYDGVIALGGDPRDPRSLVRRLRYLVDNADFALAHVRMGGTLLSNALDYAEVSHLNIRYLTLTMLVDRAVKDKMRKQKWMQKPAEQRVPGDSHAEEAHPQSE